MKETVFSVTVATFLFVNATASEVYAWSGDTWGTETRATIESLADSMINYTWTPNNTMNNWELSGTSYTFYKGTNYTGEAYSQNNPQESKSEFANLVSTTAGGTTYYGNDCSGFVSMCWKLPSRYTTATFESDAVASGGYVSSLGGIGTAQTTLLLRGDALNASGNHIVLVKEKISSGIKTMEQTPPKARFRDWTYAQLSSYRPIRRNSMNEMLYSGYLASGAQAIQPNSTYYYSSAAGSHSARLGGPASADFDLRLYKWNGSAWQIVASSMGMNSTESIDYNGTAGYYYWRINAYSGSGNYILSIKKP